MLECPYCHTEFDFYGFDSFGFADGVITGFTTYNCRCGATLTLQGMYEWNGEVEVK